MLQTQLVRILTFMSLAIFVGTLALAGVGDAEKPVRICYFSLNNGKEFVEMQKFVERLSKHSSQKIEVVEFVDSNNKNLTAEEHFTAMCSSGVECHGLVISGHHTGAWGGERVKDDLSLEHIEKMTCDPRCANWFTNINALWLQGCETLKENVQGISADSRGRRVGAHRRRQGTGNIQDLAQLQREYSATLDQDNPLSSRYMRVAPKATIFGWTAVAPGEQWHSEYSIPYHIAHTIKRLRKEKRATNPVKDDFSARDALRYGEVLIAILSHPEGQQKSCETEAIKGWYSHGHAVPGEPGFIQPDLAAYNALYSTNKQLLLDARLNQCLFIEPKREVEILAAVDNILKSEEAIGYNFNSIWGLVQTLRAKRDKQEEFELSLYLKLMEKLKSPMIRSFIVRSLNEPNTALLVKVDNYAFYRDANETGDALLEEKLIAGARKELFYNPQKIEVLDTLFYKKSVLDSLVKNGLMTDERAEKLLKELISKNQDATSLSTAGWLLEHLLQRKPPYDSQRASAHIKAIMGMKKTDAYARFILADLIGDHWNKLENPRELYVSLLDRAKFDRNGFAASEFIDAAVAIANREETKDIKEKSMAQILALALEQIRYIPSHQERDEYLEAKRKIYHSLRNKGHIPVTLAQSLIDDLTSKKIDSTNAILASGMLALHFEHASSENKIKHPEKYVKALIDSPASGELVHQRLMHFVNVQWANLENPAALYISLLNKAKPMRSMELAKDYISDAVFALESNASLKKNEKELRRRILELGISQLSMAPRNVRDYAPYEEFKGDLTSTVLKSDLLSQNELEAVLNATTRPDADGTTLGVAFNLIEQEPGKIKNIEKRLKSIYHAKGAGSELRQELLKYIDENADVFKSGRKFLGKLRDKDAAAKKD